MRLHESSPPLATSVPAEPSAAGSGPPLPQREQARVEPERAQQEAAPVRAQQETALARGAAEERERLAPLGRRLAGASHDLVGVLGAVRMRLELLEAELADPDRALPHVHFLQRALADAAARVSGLHELARQASTPAPETASVPVDATAGTAVKKGRKLRKR